MYRPEDSRFRSREDLDSKIAIFVRRRRRPLFSGPLWQSHLGRRMYLFFAVLYGGSDFVIMIL